MMKKIRRLSVAVLTLLLAACGTVGSVNPTTGELYTQPSVELTENTAVSSETATVAYSLYKYGPYGNTVKALPGSGVVDLPNATAALLYIIYDPFAPNWSVQEQRLNEDTYYLAMRAKSFRTGGDGEAVQILKRRALRLQREKGFTSYRILDYSEGVESSTPFSHRVSEGTIQLVRAEASPKKK